jgi:predicted transcriptional regulator
LRITILVKNGAGQAIGVLEGWKITPKDYEKKVKDITLGKIQLLPKNTDIESVRKALEIVSAVYITDPDANDAIIGVITSYDLFKAATA